MPPKRIHHPVLRILKTGTTVLALLLLVACVTTPAKVVSTPGPAEQTDVLIAPQNSPPPAPILAKIESPPLLPAEPAATPPPPVAAAEHFIADATTESAPLATIAQPEYYQSYASYYAKRFNGRRTYTGERYDPNLLTAATRDFPLQSWLKVINPANGREVTVRVNDRTGKRKTPLIDLSRAAAKELGFLGKGKIRVHVIPLLPDSSLTPREND